MANISVALSNAPGRSGVSAVERRLASLPIPATFVVGSIAALMVLSGDLEVVTPVPLLGLLNKEFGMTPAQGAWSLSNGVVAAVSVPVLCRLGDIFGMRRFLLASMVFVVLGNALDAMGQGPVMYILGRAIVAFSASTPIFYALIRLRYPSEGGVDRGAGLMSAALGGGIVVGFLLGGVVVQLGGTVRTVLWLMTLVSVLVLLLTWLFVPDSPTRTRIKIDFLGAALLGSPLALIVVAIGQANAWGWTSALTLGLLGLAVLLLIAWAVWEVTFPFPMIDLRIVKRREIWPALLAGGLAGVLGPSSTLTISNWVQTPISAGYGFGGNVLTAGIYLIPVGVAIGFSASLARPIIKRIGQRASVILGGLISAGVFSWFAGNHTETWQYFVVMAVFGVGWALTTTGAISNYLRHARPGEGGMITGAGRIAQTGLSAVGPTIITALITASFVQGTAVPQSDNYSHVYIFFAVCGLLVIGLGLAMRDSRINHQLAPHTEVIGSGVVSVGEAAG